MPELQNFHWLAHVELKHTIPECIQLIYYSCVKTTQRKKKTRTHARQTQLDEVGRGGGVENVWSSVGRGRIVPKCFCVGDGGRKGGVASSRIFKGENKTVNCNAKVSTLFKKHLAEPVECVQKSISTDRCDSLLMCRRNRVEWPGIQLVPK